MDIRRFVSKEGSFTWTMTTNGYKLYTLNLVSWLRTKANVSWTLCVICCDPESYEFFRREHVPCLFFAEKAEGGQHSMSVFGSASFARLNLKKLRLLDWIQKTSLSLGIRKSLYLDGDIVVAQDPWPLLDTIQRIRGGSLFFQCDCFHSDVHETCRSICSGCIVHYHENNEPFSLYKVETEPWKAAEMQDQPYIQTRLQTLAIPFDTLPRDSFGNGGWQKGGAWKTQPWVLLHYNYRSGDSKKSAMKAAGHWLLA